MRARLHQNNKTQTETINLYTFNKPVNSRKTSFHFLIPFFKVYNS